MDFLEIMDFVAYDIEKAHELIREIYKAEAKRKEEEEKEKQAELRPIIVVII